VYEEFVSEKIDEISRILYEREPTPVAVDSYYKTLVERESKSGCVYTVKLA
jgi:hypothetical protein